MNMFKAFKHSAMEPNALTYELMAEIQMERDSDSAISLINTMKWSGFAVLEKLLEKLAKTKDDDDDTSGMSENRTPPWKKGWTGQENVLYGRSHGKPWEISFAKDDYETVKLNNKNNDFNFTDRMCKVQKKHPGKVKHKKVKNQKK